jgi:hypothetical protein
MGSPATVIFPQNIGQNPRELLGLVGLPSDAEHTAKQLSGSANDLIRSVVSIIDDLILRAIRQRTREDFEATRSEVYPQYFAAMTALGMLISITVPKEEISWLAAQSLSELEADFRDTGASSFGAGLRDRGLFTVWILRKIAELAPEVLKAQSLPETKKQDNELALQFGSHAVWSRFHIDCLVNSMHSRTPIFPDVVPSIEEGLRAAVNAYAWIRQAVDLRVGHPEQEIPPIQLDDDDEAFLADSMREWAKEES